MNQDKYYFLFKKNYIRLKGVKSHHKGESLRGNGKVYNQIQVRHVMSGLCR